MDEELKKQKARERAKRYYEKNKVKILQRQKEYAKRKYHEDEEYRQRRIQNCRNYCERNPEKVREIKRLSQKKYYQKYKEYYRQYQKEHSKQYQKNHREKIKKQITDLQEEVNKLTAESTEWESKCYNLQEENERLKEIIENLTTMTVCGDRKQIKNTAQYKLDIYKQRNEKAIEYVEHHKFNKFGDIDCGEAEELLNILNGDDEE